MQGLLLVDKPKDWTSFDVVNYVRRIVSGAQGTKPKNTKVGHTGTLDPAATGLLVLLVGKEYTRRAPECMKLDKTYEVTMQLGVISTTGDSEGQLTEMESQEYTTKAVLNVLESFLGDSMQVPPAFSAMKINGKRAYELARASKPVELEPRPVHIDSLELTNYTYPDIAFTVSVSSGTYIRSLVEDIGKALGTGAYMTDLRRTRVGEWLLTEAISQLQGLTADQIEHELRQL